MPIHLACDVGGTFTDLVVARNGHLSIAKVPTTPEDPELGVFNVLALAASQAGLDRRGLLSQTEIFVHATTRAINALLTGTMARTALLTTEGHRDILLLREGGRLNPYDNSVPFPNRSSLSRSLSKSRRG